MALRCRFKTYVLVVIFLLILLFYKNMLMPELRNAFKENVVRVVPHKKVDKVVRGSRENDFTQLYTSREKVFIQLRGSPENLEQTNTYEKVSSEPQTNSLENNSARQTNSRERLTDFNKSDSTNQTNSREQDSVKQSNSRENAPKELYTTGSHEKNPIELTNSSDKVAKARSSSKSAQPYDRKSKKTYPLTIKDNVYLIRNEKVCERRQRVDFLFVVHSATSHSESRQAIRRTWGNPELLSTLNAELIFVLGKPKLETEQKLIIQESETCGDIVQGNFLDTYRNLTNKAILALRWISEECRKTKYVIKLDDDVFVNSIKVFHAISNRTYDTSDDRFIFCPVIKKDTAKIQRSSGKWKVDENEFVNKTFWPVTFCRGFFVVMTGNIVPELYNAAKTTPFFWIDDVYVYGLLVEKAGNISHYGWKDLRQHARLLPSSDKMYQIWNNLTLSTF